MKSIAQIVQNNLRLLAAYEDKVQPRFLSRYAREPMDAAAVYRKLRALDPGPDAPARLGDVGVIGLYVGTTGIVVLAVSVVVSEYASDPRTSGASSAPRQVATTMLVQPRRGAAVAAKLVVVLAALVTTASLWWARRMIVVPLTIISSHFESIAKGNLARPIAVYGKNEISAIFAGLKAMQGALRDTVSQVREASLQIDVGSRELSAGTEYGTGSMGVRP